MNHHQRSFKIENDNGEEVITHTWNKPYPEMYFKKKKKIIQTMLKIGRKKIKMT
jgi:hypothetical protein